MLLAMKLEQFRAHDMTRECRDLPVSHDTAAISTEKLLRYAGSKELNILATTATELAMKWDCGRLEQK
jgi:hypothetical protein